MAIGILGPDGNPWRNGNGHHNPRLDDDVARGLLGDAALPQVITFQAVMGSAWKAFWHNREDEALRDSRPDAQAMLRDPFLTGLVRERIRAVTGLSWHLEGHDERDPAQVELKDQITAAIEKTPDFLNFLAGLCWSVWYGRYAQQIVPRWHTIKGRNTLVVDHWIPTHGDKIGHTWAGVPYVLVNTAWADRLPDAETFISTYGRGLLLRGRWRERFVLHKHDVLDGDYFDPESAGSVHGLGIRHWIYWYNWVRLEYMEWIATYLERVGLGLTLWMYDASNPDAKGEAATAAKEAGRRTNLLVPVWKDARGGGQTGGVERVETPVSGVDALTALQEEMKGVIERFIVGQSMSSGNDSEGSLGGTGRANFAKDTKAAITREDARRLGETLTGRPGAPGLVHLIQSYSRPDMAHVPLRFVFDVDDPESKDKVSAAKTCWDMGVSLKADEVRGAAGFSKPTQDDEVCQKPDEQEQQAPAGPDPQALAQEQQVEQQAKQQELAHAQAKHEQELKHKEEAHAHDMRREATRTQFDAQNEQRKAAFQAQQEQRKATLAAQQQAEKARQQAAQRQQQAQQAQAAPPAVRQAAAFLRGRGEDGLAEAVLYGRTPTGPLRYDRSPDWDEAKVARDPEGKFAHRGEGKAAKGSKGVWSRLASAGDALGRGAKRLKASAMRKLDPAPRKKVRKILAVCQAVEAKCMTAFHHARALAREVAEERGATPEQADRAATAMGAADLTLAWTTTFPVVTALTGNPVAGKVAAFVPVASMAYLAYATVAAVPTALTRNPLRTIRAARDLIARTRQRVRDASHGGLGESLEALSEEARRGRALMHEREGEADQYGWDDMGPHQGGPKHRYRGTPPDKGNRYQISPPGSRKKAPSPAPAGKARRERKAPEGTKKEGPVVPPTPQPGRVYNVPTGDLKVDPKRFQFKLNTDNPAGVTQELKQVKTFNPDFAGVLAVWKDPADGQTYVVNGHHRHELAARLGHPDLAVRYVEANDAREARALGALVNIAEGRGTATDAAKFMRDMGVSGGDLEKYGVSMKGAVARDAATLTALNDRLFDRLATGRLELDRALAIAAHLPDATLQDQLFGLVEKQEEKRGHDLPAKVVAEMAREMAATPTTTKQEMTLFGMDESVESLFVHRNELKSHVRGELAKEVGDWLAVASKRRAGRVAQGGNVLDVDANKEAAQQASQVQAVYDTLVNSKGPISDALNEAAGKYAEAKTKSAKNAAKREALERVRDAIFRELERTAPPAQ